MCHSLDSGSHLRHVTTATHELAQHSTLGRTRRTLLADTSLRLGKPRIAHQASRQTRVDKQAAPHRTAAGPARHEGGGSYLQSESVTDEPGTPKMRSRSAALLMPVAHKARASSTEPAHTPSDTPARAQLPGGAPSHAPRCRPRLHIPQDLWFRENEEGEERREEGCARGGAGGMEPATAVLSTFCRISPTANLPHFFAARGARGGGEEVEADSTQMAPMSRKTKA